MILILVLISDLMHYLAACSLQSSALRLRTSESGGRSAESQIAESLTGFWPLVGPIYVHALRLDRHVLIHLHHHFFPTASTHPSRIHLTNQITIHSHYLCDVYSSPPHPLLAGSCGQPPQSPCLRCRPQSMPSISLRPPDRSLIYLHPIAPILPFHPSHRLTLCTTTRFLRPPINSPSPFSTNPLARPARPRFSVFSPPTTPRLP